MNMKRLVVLLAFFALGFGAMAQAVSDATIAKRENRKGMVLKEYFMHVRWDNFNYPIVYCFFLVLIQI